MTVYYQDRAVQVTSRAVSVHGQRYPIAQIDRLWHQRGRRDARAASRLAGRWVLFLVLAAPVIVGAFLLGRALAAEQSTAARFGVTLLLVTVGLVVLGALLPLFEVPLYLLDRSYDRGTTVHEIWMHWQGERLMLLSTGDAQRFGQVYRAIQRAVEQHDTAG